MQPFDKAACQILVEAMRAVVMQKGFHNVILGEAHYSPMTLCYRIPLYIDISYESLHATEHTFAGVPPCSMLELCNALAAELQRLKGIDESTQSMLDAIVAMQRARKRPTKRKRKQQQPAEIVPLIQRRVK